jgi:hypothetical protein
MTRVRISEDALHDLNDGFPIRKDPAWIRERLKE